MGNFVLQLLMDGQYGKLAFICTKVDDINTGKTINTLGVKRICKDVSRSKFFEDLNNMSCQIVRLSCPSDASLLFIGRVFRFP
jgi:hypothetical protein